MPVPNIHVFAKGFGQPDRGDVPTLRFDRSIPVHFSVRAREEFYRDEARRLAELLRRWLPAGTLAALRAALGADADLDPLAESGHGYLVTDRALRSTEARVREIAKEEVCRRLYGGDHRFFPSRARELLERSERSWSSELREILSDLDDRLRRAGY